MKKYTLFFFLLFLGCLTYGQTQNCACCTENHKAFDFWIGEWEVTNTDGSAAGKNTIEKIQSDCMLSENWISASAGFTGTSINFYNQRTGQWEQLWVDNAGNQLKLKGKKVGNQMILSSDEFKRNDGLLYVNRITWTANDDGSVRQLWEVLQKDSVVSVAFDGLYKKVN
ncbi:MAG: hypothetical protein AB3N14_19680 [Flavobacteriaceae bacterium]